MRDSASILPPSEETLELCAELLRKDKLVAVPTETVYGLAGNSLRIEAVRKIFEVKGRPLVDPLISHFSHPDAVFEHTKESREARLLAEAFWPGPLTLVLPKKSTIPDIVTAGLPSAGVRVPEHQALRALLSKINFPLAAPSANPFGYVSPTRPSHVAETLGSKISAILDGGPSTHGIESTIVDLRLPESPKILRPGPITKEELERTLGIPVEAITAQQSQEIDDSPQSAPGMMTKHYSPRTIVRIIEHGSVSPPTTPLARSNNVAILANKRPSKDAVADHIYWLSEDGALREASQNLFHLLQVLDNGEYDQIDVEAFPDEGIGHALNDRLRRAAAK